MNSLVSIIIPTYKRNSCVLKRALLSAVSQTYKNIEIIVVDDNAGNELKSFRNSNIELIFNEPLFNKVVFIQNENNLGGALSRNEGIKIAKGDFITFLDDDDAFLPNKVLHQVSYMNENKLNCSFTDLSLYDESERLVDRRTRDDISDFSRESLLKYHLTKGITGTETFMVSKAVLDDIGGFDDAIMGQEFYLMFKILYFENLKIGYFVSDDIKAYRTNSEAISTGPNKIKGELLLYMFKKDYFCILTKKEINYVKWRHRVIMAVAYYRNHKLIHSAAYLFISFLTNPALSIKETILFKKRKKKIY